MKPKLAPLESLTLQATILEKLGIGHRNAIGLKDLCKRTGANERKLRLAIESLRLQGYIVLFAQKEITKDTKGNKIIFPSGYFIGETREESEEFYQYMKSRVICECLVMRSIKLATRKKFEKTVGQLSLI